MSVIFFHSQELLNCHCCVTERIVMVQDPAILPFLRLSLPHILTQTCRNLNIVSSSNASPPRHKFVVHYAPFKYQCVIPGTF
jgi:hypothetical protein